MKIIKINLAYDCRPALTAALAVLRQGGVIVYPTDTVYGLGANACDWKAAEQVFKIKNRSLGKPLPIIARNLAWAKALAHIPSKLESLLAQLWPGTVTVILAKRPVIPPIVTAGGQTVGLRIPDFSFTDQLLGSFGYPLTATSANLSGEEGNGNVQTVLASFQNQLWKPDLVIDAGILPKRLPSTVLDLSTIQPKILRVGPTKPEFLMKLLGATYAKTQNPKRSSPPEKGN